MARRRREVAPSTMKNALAPSCAPAVDSAFSCRPKNSRAAPAGRVLTIPSKAPSRTPMTAATAWRGRKCIAAAAAAIWATSFQTGRRRRICAIVSMASRLIFAPTEAHERSADINRLDDLEFLPQRIDFETHHLGHQPVAEFIGPPPAVLGDRRPGREGFLIDHQGFASQARAGNVAGDDKHGGFPSSFLTGPSRRTMGAYSLVFLENI